MFNASIINLKSGAQETGTSVNYKTINDGMEVMQTLASRLSYKNDTEWRIDSAENFKRAVDIINERKEGNFAVILMGNITLSAWVIFSENGAKTITITGDSQMRTINHCQISVSEGIHLVLGNNVTLDGNGKGTVVIVNGNLTMQEGAILRNGGRGGVEVIGGSFTMNGGTISGNTAIVGGGVSVRGGMFTMNGGTINDNTAIATGGNEGAGGGVFISSDGGGGTFRMSGGTISGNTAGGDGGGVSISDRGTFTMTGGTISGNTAKKYGGGGVRNNGGTFTMSGGTISNNTTNDNGGGIVNTGTFTMSGGTISGNTTNRDGGGVYVYNSGTFVKTGGTIDATNSAKTGKVAWSGNGKRDRAAGPNDNLDSNKKGRAGGWE
jgi:hypothetical protein